MAEGIAKAAGGYPTLAAIPADDYHADKIADVPSLSCSIAKILCTQSPLHAWTAHPRLNPDFRRVEAEKFDVGTAAHALLFFGEAGVEVVEADSWRTNAAKDARDAARSVGRLPLLEKDWGSVQAMVAAIRSQLDAVNVDHPIFADGVAEQTVVWEEDGGVVCRARPDWVGDAGVTIDDLKTTSRSANPETWSRTIFGMGYDVQAAFYLRGMQAVDEVAHDRDFRFVVAETTPPYALSVISLGPAAMTIAEKKVSFAIDLWRKCMATNDWPAYSTRVAYAELPPWEEAAWLEREMSEAA
jgi:hypothetical protein